MSIPTDKTGDTQTEPKTQPELTPLEIAEKRAKDTQVSFTKGQQEISSLKAQNAKLQEQLVASVKVDLTPEQTEQLDSLMYKDPTEWRRQMNELEGEALSKTKTKVAELSSEASEAANQAFEIDRRTRLLKDFNDSATIPITDEVIANDVPPRITNKLRDGKITYEDFLSEVDSYINKGKTVGKEETLKQPNMGNLGGGKTPNDVKPEKSLSENYSKDLY